MIHSARLRNRAGYTLTEVLIAAVLVATLMAACWNLMSLYSAFITSGRTEVVERQLVRSVFQLITEDIERLPLSTAAADRSALPQSRLPLEIADLPDSIGGQAFASTLLDGAFTPELLVRPVIEMTGTDRSLQLRYIVPAAAEPGGEPVTADADPLAGSVSASMQTVVYQFREPVPAIGPYPMLPFGLHRVEADGFHFEEAVTSTREATATMPDGGAGIPAGPLNQAVLEWLMAPPETPADQLESLDENRIPPQHDHVPEVVRCEFEYHDGRNWTRRWNTSRRRSLPTAIRLTVWLVSSEDVNTIREYFGGLDADAVRGEKNFTEGTRIRPRRYQRVLVLRPSAKAGDQSALTAEVRR